MSTGVIRRVARLMVLTAAVSLLPLVHAAAAQPPAAAQDEYVPVAEIPVEEQLPAQPLLFSAYAFIWVAVLVYVLLLWRRLAAVEKDLDALRRAPRS